LPKSLEENGGVYGTRTRGLRRDRQRRGCGRDWQRFATFWNDWKSLREKHRLLSRFRRAFQAASYTWVTVNSLAGRRVAETFLGSRGCQPSRGFHLDGLQALRGRKVGARPNLKRHPRPGPGASSVRIRADVRRPQLAGRRSAPTDGVHNRAPCNLEQQRRSHRSLLPPGGGPVLPPPSTASLGHCAQRAACGAIRVAVMEAGKTLPGRRGRRAGCRQP
jgi:hypothetical protein